MYNNVNNKLIKFASSLSFIIAAIILCVKYYGWITTQSQSILASLIDSSLDVTSALINLIAILFATQPPDNNHRFGHEKFEDLAVFSQSIFFFSTGIFVIVSCIRSILNTNNIVNQNEGLKIMYICIFLTLSMAIFQSYVIKKTNSNIISVDRLHFTSDFLSYIAVVISIMLSKSFAYIDSLMGIGIGLYIIYNSFSLFRNVLNNLSDAEFEPKERQKIIDVVSKFPEVRDIHNIKTRKASNKPFIQFHIEMDDYMTLGDAHVISNNICDELKKIFPLGEILIYHDPYNQKKDDINFSKEFSRKNLPN